MKAGATIEFETPQLLFGGIGRSSLSMADYDVTPDGQFLIREQLLQPPHRLHLVLNWSGELERLMEE